MTLRHGMRALLCGALVMAALPALAEDRFAAEGTFDIPAGAHFSPDRLKRIGEFFEKQIADNKIPGAVVLIQQHGKPVYKQFFGVRDPDTGQPMTDDTIFRLHSMTKPLTSFAAMMLVDEGRLKLDEMISQRLKLEDINVAFDEMRRGELARSVIVFDQ